MRHRAMLITSLLCLAMAPPALGARYSLQIVPSPNAFPTWARGLTETGAVIGEVSGFGPWAGGLASRGVVWHGGNLALLDLPPGHSGVGRDINASGVAVGASALPDAGEVPASQATVWSGGTFQTLGTFGGPTSEARHINDSGVIVGVADSLTGESVAFLRTTGGLRTINGVGLATSEANDLSDSGYIVGMMLDGGFQRAWSHNLGNGQTTFLPLPGHATYSSALRVNNRGDVVGRALLPLGNQLYLFSADTFQMLDPEFTHANDLNDLRQIAGVRTDPQAGDSAVLWDRGQMIDLSSELAGSIPWRLTEALAVNNAGQVLARGTVADGSGDMTVYSVLLTPIPEPAFALAVTGCWLVNRTRRAARPARR